MSRIAGEVTIAAPVGDVFDIVADERNEPRYNPRIVGVVKVSEGPVGAGSQFVVEPKGMGAKGEMTVRIVGFDRPHRLHSVVRSSYMQVDGTLTFDEFGGATRLRWDWDMRLVGRMRLLSPVLALVGPRWERRNWVALKTYMESAPRDGSTRSMKPTGNLEIETGRGRMPVYFSVPEVPPPWPGVVVIHDFTGMSQDLRAQADWLASEGFLAVAPDLYYWGSRLGCLRTIMRDLGQRRGRSFDDIEAARGWLRDHDGCTGSIGVIGFCMGGGYAVALAANRGFASASVNYGGCPSDAEAWVAEACPIVGSFGSTDSSPLGSRAGRRLGELLTDHEVPHDVKIYAGVGHGFMNDHAPEDQTLLLRFLARISGTEYDEAATHDARRRIVEFFNRYLKQDATSSP